MNVAVWKATLDLAALALIWGGTMAITLGGVPALISRVITGGGQTITAGGRAISVGHTKESDEAHHRYRRWAWPGAGLITIGAAWQTVGPLAVLIPGHRWLTMLGQGIAP